MTTGQINWDAFISHAFEDKTAFAKKLADSLNSIGVNVWYDDFSLKVGDSLSKSIDNGLINSKYGIVIISKSFLEKGWTDYEYRSLLSREVGFKKVILPIWLDITKEEVQKYSPYLSDKFALSTSRHSLQQIILKLIEVIRSDIFDNYMRHLKYLVLIKNSKTLSVDANELQPHAIQHETLPQTYINRIKTFHYGIDKYLNGKLERTIENFKRDTNPVREIEVWEMLNATFLDFLNKHDITDDKIKSDIAKQLLLFSIGKISEKTILTKVALTELYEMWEANFSHDRQKSEMT